MKVSLGDRSVFEHFVFKAVSKDTICHILFRIIETGKDPQDH